MPFHVCNGATLMCSFGMAPSVMGVLPIHRMLTSSQPAANINDHVDMVNIMPFGMCTTPSNPEVASATAAALGRSDADAVHTGHAGALGSRRRCAAGDPRRRAGPGRHQHPHVHMGRSDQGPVRGPVDRDDLLTAPLGGSTAQAALAFPAGGGVTLASPPSAKRMPASTQARTHG